MIPYDKEGCNTSKAIQQFVMRFSVCKSSGRNFLHDEFINYIIVISAFYDAAKISNLQILKFVLRQNIKIYPKFIEEKYNETQRYFITFSNKPQLVLTTSK